VIEREREMSEREKLDLTTKITNNFKTIRMGIMNDKISIKY
jgi:hypothetical protein